MADMEFRLECKRRNSRALAVTELEWVQVTKQSVSRRWKTPGGDDKALYQAHSRTAKQYNCVGLLVKIIADYPMGKRLRVSEAVSRKRQVFILQRRKYVLNKLM